MAQAEIPVHMLNRGRENVKYSGVQLDEPEDEKITVTNTTHLGAEDLDLKYDQCVEIFSHLMTVEMKTDGSAKRTRKKNKAVCQNV